MTRATFKSSLHLTIARHKTATVRKGVEPASKEQWNLDSNQQYSGLELKNPPQADANLGPEDLNNEECIIYSENEQETRNWDSNVLCASSGPITPALASTKFKPMAM
ncbi:hypothetical protein AVEN_18253-1 [Araneus ventricosus]|uniref:Uncharacterized protein n=1 Tax=Araneus ventricosus TaxID=182803 RepID=A0A4Y2AIN6_ARAVE|nr:hypothetical protein AVEN_18253-1 [Araneus ventricosus]